MNRSEALRVVENLRKGIPPTGFIEHFTVGRKSEIEALQARLNSGKTTVLLLKANYGSGKSHLLRLINERALLLGYAVSYVTLDAKSGVRFNRMDQILGAIFQAIKLPLPGYEHGVRGLLDFACASATASQGGRMGRFWSELTNNGKWQYSEALKSPGFYIALRAWQTGNSDARETVVDWLLKSEQYSGQRKELYARLVANLHMHFRDPRPEKEFYEKNVFLFFRNSYRQSWDTLADTYRILVESGLKGLVILFDEFEDVLTNLSRVDYKEAAFANLFLFFAGERFPGMTFYAVTPAFVAKCKDVLLEGGHTEFNYNRFDHLPTYSMSPLEEKELQELAQRIIAAHAIAYEYGATYVGTMEIQAIVSRCARSPVQDRVRYTIREVVKHLDDKLKVQ